MPQKIACFNQLTGASAWWALLYTVRGWKVLYFDRTRIGGLLASLFTVLLLKRVSFRPVEYHVGDHPGLFADISRLALTITEKWFERVDNELAKRFFLRLGQPQRTQAFIKKATIGRVRKLVQRIALFERLTRGFSQDARFLVEGSATTRQFIQEFRHLTGKVPYISTLPAFPAKVALVFGLVYYYAKLGTFLVRRGLRVRPIRESYLVAKRAIWPMGRRRGDDFLVDDETILPSDLLLFYNSGVTKPQVREAIRTARKAGYEPVAWDRLPIQWKWLANRKTITTYLAQPLWQLWHCLWSSGQEGVCEVALLLLRLRGQMRGWDVFFERYRVGCLLDDSTGEEQSAATMSIHNHGGVSVMVQVSDDMYDDSDADPYLTRHYLFTWGRGGAELWEGNWCVDEIIPIGYIWGHLHQETLKERDRVRALHGANENTTLIAAFDNSVSRDGFITPADLHRFCNAIEGLASTLENTTVVFKPKNPEAATPLPKREETHVNSFISGNWLWDTNELIAAADVVVSLDLSTVGIEALVCGVPTVIRDETGRDWHKVLKHPDAVVVNNAADLPRAVDDALQRKIDPQIWTELQERIRHNYGVVDGLALTRLRAKILDVCGVKRTAGGRTSST